MKRLVFSLLISLTLVLCSCRGPAPIQPGNGSDPISESQSGPETSTSALETDPSGTNYPAPTQPAQVAGPGTILVTSIDSEGIGRIAVQISLPEVPRYGEEAGIVVEVNTFLTPSNSFYSSLNAPAVGLIHISYLWPGLSDGTAASDGEFDFGGEASIRALKDVLRFATGETPNSEGYYLDQLISPKPLYENVGLYAFSHPGLAAVNVMGHHGDQFSRLAYFVGRENPTMDKLTAVEIGYYGENSQPELNPLYEYPEDYSPQDITLDYGSIQWDPDYTEPGSRWLGVPYFDLNGNGIMDFGDHHLGLRVPAVDGKRVYSIELTQALRENHVFPPGKWPQDVADLSLVKETWIYQDSTRTYPEVGQQLPDLKVMLVFARDDHVQPASDKPHIHQAYDGFSAADLWVRLNPDAAYIEMVSSQVRQDYQEHPANFEPTDWRDSQSWGYQNLPGASQLVPLAAVAEMADRVQAGNWSPDLSGPAG